MKKNFKIITSVLVLSAACTMASAAGFTAPSQILGIDVGDTNRVIIRLSSNTECNTPLVTISRSQPYYKDVLAMAVLAYSSGKNVQFYVVSCANEAVVVRMVTGSVWQ